MPDRLSTAASRPPLRRAAITVDVVVLTPHGRRLALLLSRSTDPKSKERWELPWESPRADENIDDAAGRLTRARLGTAPALIEQVGAFGDRRRHPSSAELSIAYLALVPAGTTTLVGGDLAWFPIDDLPPASARHQEMIEAALSTLRARVDQSPIAFRLLPPTFTLSQLQEIYEMLLGRRLHKASFRRALHAAWLVEPTDEWRSEGRGRPAQLFRFSPRKRRGNRRGVRFEGLA